MAKTQRTTSKKICRLCGHWSNGPEFGLDDHIGYCNYWQSLKKDTFGCDNWISGEDYREVQDALAEQMDEGSEDFDDDS
ncbi:MAG: hypothetical protein CVT48_02495 [Thermoplasmata archaeon HGW-Thermoplasmata-1]|nr:MAG: hypothetical protein CVT48_02495 [Thermoplasmata archaeon HGW-Thermoplasmata-1]